MLAVIDFHIRVRGPRLSYLVSDPAEPLQVEKSPAMSRTLFHNCVITTLDPALPHARAFVAEGEIYRTHSGSRIRAAMHPLADDLTHGRKHVYVGGPLDSARLIWERGDYARLLDAFGTVIDEVIVWPPEAPVSEPAGTPSSGARSSG